MAELPVAFLNRLKALEGSYLRETDPIRQSGFGGGHQRWRTERALVLDAVPSDGDFLDIGCANGYLLECLVQWGHERHVHLTPYGVDCGAQLITLAQQRLPQYAAHFWVANAWEWMPPRQFRYVYSVYDCVPVELLPEYIRRLLTRYVEQGGTLIIGAYGSYSKQEAARDIAQDIAAAGFRVAGSSSQGELPVSRVAWIQTEQGHGADAVHRAAHAQRVCQAWHRACGVQVPTPGMSGAEGEEQGKGAIARWRLEEGQSECAGRRTGTGEEVWCTRDEWARDHEVLQARFGCT